MSTTTARSGRSSAPRAPEKGSFPLDHYGDCREFAKAYEECLQENNSVTRACRVLARDYLNCRMDRELMAKESWERLGLDDISASGGGSDDVKVEEDKPRKGFVAGTRAGRQKG